MTNAEQRGRQLAYQLTALKDIKDERKRQDEKWGPQHHSPAKWMTILMEEVGEAAQEVLDGNSDSIYNELVQVAAVCVAVMENIQWEMNAPLDVTIVAGANAMESDK